jgi:photosystem II stability/assembly factor-like uncharacterized protein
MSVAMRFVVIVRLIAGEQQRQFKHYVHKPEKNMRFIVDQMTNSNMRFAIRFLIVGLLFHMVALSARAVTLVAVGGYGAILRSEDSGLHWTSVNSHTTNHLRSVSFINSNEGWAVGWNSTMLHTVDGGKTWSVKSNNIGDMWSIDFVDSNHGWVGSNVPNGDSGVVWRTVDGGMTWQSSNKIWDWSIKSVDFTDTQNGWAVAENGGILLTTDGGASWTIKKPPGSTSYNNVKAIDANNAWVAGTYDMPGCYGPLIHTADGGNSWSIPSFYFHVTNDITFVGTEGWLAGNEKSVFHTLDSGLTWTETVRGTQYEQTVGTDFYSVAFDPIVGCWASGNNGKIAFSSDHGATWSAESTQINTTLYDIAIVPIPEPSTFTLLGMGVVGLLAYSRRWRK